MASKKKKKNRQNRNGIELETNVGQNKDKTENKDRIGN